MNENYVIYREGKKYTKAYEELDGEIKVMRVMGKRKDLEEWMRYLDYRVIEIFSLKHLIETQNLYRGEFIHKFRNRHPLYKMFDFVKSIHFDKYYVTYKRDEIPRNMLSKIE